jgi:hypothetical protein
MELYGAPILLKINNYYVQTPKRFQFKSMIKEAL